MREKHKMRMRMWIGAPCFRRRAYFGFCSGIALSPPVTYDIRVPKISVPPVRGAGAALCRGKGKLIVVLLYSRPRAIQGSLPRPQSVKAPARLALARPRDPVAG